MKRSLVVGLISPVALFAAVALWAFWPTGEAETPSVNVRESGQLVARASESRALQMLKDRVGFRPVIPGVFPIEGLTLAIVDSGLPPEPGLESPISSLRFIAVETAFQPESVILSQSKSFQGGIPPDARPIDLGVKGAVAWQLRSSPPVSYLVQRGNMFVQAVVLRKEPLTDADILPMLRSIATKLR